MTRAFTFRVGYPASGGLGGQKVIREKGQVFRSLDREQFVSKPLDADVPFSAGQACGNQRLGRGYGER